MIRLLTDGVIWFNWFVLSYFLLLNSVQLGLFTIAAADITSSFRWSASNGFDELFANPLTPGISVIVPAYNEAAGIAQSVRAMLTIHYPLHEVVVVEDGSTDDTFAILERTFALVEVKRVFPNHIPTIGAVRSVWAAGTGEPLVVIRKDNAGLRSDALNVGLNYAQHELVCMVDADSILEADALLRVAKPFVDDPLRVVGSGGVIRAVNGATIDRGRIVDVKAPKSWLVRIQIVEYLRSFLLGRTGWSRISGLLIISGAFGLFRKDLVYEVGGLDAHTMAEDADLVTTLHRHLRREKRDYRMVFVAEPVCWTEVPSSLKLLERQRRRWSHGLGQLMWKFRAMIGNPRYRVIGLLTLPFYLLFEALGPVVEIAGLVSVIVGASLGLLNFPFILLIALASLGYGLFLSIAAITVEEMTFHRYERWKDLGGLLVASLVENLGYRQLHAWWRLRGLAAVLRGRPATWGEMPRVGFDTFVAEPEAASADVVEPAHVS
jgi:cellulose synthase/poly-beta-1,6-N-acetylglucosamine synthase-like glycosyltransferase